MMSDITFELFLCPVCGGELSREGQSCRCPAGHCFDIARGGYLHLLPANRMNSHEPGDDKEMVEARSRFLAKGYYAPLREALISLSLKYAPDGVRLLDLGCGEGYYTCGVVNALQAAGKKPKAAGIDISKSAVKLAARQSKATDFAVASVFHLPVADASMNLLMNCFSPLCIEEVRRTLTQGGHFIYVVPAAYHLWGLKSAVYATPYPNEQKETPYEGFRYSEIFRLESDIHLTSREDIQCLFRMTPYFWKTSKADAAKLSALEVLDTKIAFDLHVYEKL